MVNYDELDRQRSQRQQSVSMSYAGYATSHRNLYAETSHRPPEGSQKPVQVGIPTLTLYNPTLDIRMIGVNGAIIGRRQGPYMQLFENNMYISGVHAQLIYKPDTGWCVIDKHSSNGTKLNQREVQPDVPMSLKSGDIVTLANINLQVSIN
jgi:pSer/pThr/pTyr-binding forkhead associated (FHA) protein